MIRNVAKFQEWLPAGFDGQFHWEFLKGAFGPAIMPMDFDGVIERNGRFLVLETKSSENVSIPIGQRRSLKAACKTGFFSVMVIYGKSQESITAYSVWHKDREDNRKGNCNDVYTAAAKWYEWVNLLEKPTYEDEWIGKIDGLRQENNNLRQELIVSHSRIDVLSKYIEKLEVSFKLEPTKNRPIQAKSLSLALDVAA